MKSSSVLVAATIALALSMSGCAAAPSVQTSEQTTEQSASASAPPVDVVPTFRDIANESCNRATTDGVVERGEDGVMFLVPKDEAYQDYSAAFENGPDGIGLIWSTDEFFACSASNGYQVYDQDETAYSLIVNYEESTGKYHTQLEVEDYGTLDYTYSVRDGLFTAVDWVSPEESGSTTITYGSPSGELVDILHRAVDEFLADQG